MNDLISWKETTNAKPLILRGARQVGKTWLMKTFGELQFKQTIYINFEDNRELKTIFDDNFDVQRICLALELISNKQINSENTLIIFDEIQEVPRAITSLKYFQENMPELKIIAAGSMLGVALHGDVSFPVGKVDFLNLYPLTFVEFLNAIGETRLVSLLLSNDWDLIKSFKTKYIDLLKHYYFVGGMPEVVKSFIEKKDFNVVRKNQMQILNAYEQDFSKHAPNDVVPRIRMIWNSIPNQLSKESKKFIYGIIKHGARAKDFELAMQWLIDCGLIYKISRISKASIPLKAYEDFGSFKIFMVDVGLLCAMVNIEAKTLIDGSSIFEEFKGAVSEQYVLQQMVANDKYNIFYWTSENPNSQAEVDFVVQYIDKILPIEVKANENLQAKSLKSFVQKFPHAKAVRTSMSDYRKEDWLTNLPLYAINRISDISI
jgi:hypothetical protein